MKRQPDGTWRGTRQPIRLTEAVHRARWIEAETVHLKRIGLSFEAIADQITRVGRGQAAAMVALPDGVTFLVEYSITKQACYKAFKRAILREPSLETDELRKLDNARAEELFMNLQPGIRRGDVRSIEAGIRVLDHAAKIQGYSAPQKHELTGKDGKPLTLVHLLEAIGPISDDE